MRRPAASGAIDAGDLHGSLFFNVAGIGFDARIADRLAAPGARRGLLGYVDRHRRASCAAIEPGRYSIRNAFDVDGKAHMADIVDHPALFIALANSRQYGSGAQIAPSALLDDGMIEIVVVEPQSGFSIMRQVPAFFRGTLREGPGLLMRSDGVVGFLLAPHSLSRGRRAARRAEFDCAQDPAWARC